MSKRSLRLAIRIPPYRTPRNAWRRKIHREVVKAQRETPVEYLTTDRLEVEARIYMDERQLERHDVDNRLKNVLDALQGRVGGPKRIRSLKPIVPNDHQIFRVVIEKKPVPDDGDDWGELIVRRYSPKKRLVRK